jgi:hypothetical protein
MTLEKKDTRHEGSLSSLNNNTKEDDVEEVKRVIQGTAMINRERALCLVG